ncbi:2-dehydro-3-deoxygalactonokinase [Algibacillus agarilyticus]|uniref:2-dehydro-3-deoxygalactonokinase n=1 Tax=Algibacillus agarilyticus TaxID=2234133 RepID=UPI000DD0A14A|nr:2-dehydro-3-deoxygalactonokinase [Algibacillus agarilyticus]
MTTKNIATDLLIIDWGTTNFRAFAMDESGTVIDKKEQPMGLLQVEDGNFAAALESVLTGWIHNYQTTPVYMAGMVGSQMGWVNVDYTSTPVGEDSLANNVHSFELPWGAKATIIPGVSHQIDTGAFDVMRGEEVQLFGLSKVVKQDTLAVILPGTHSKHATFSHGKMTAFSSFMTGELFSVISKHTILGKGLPEQLDSPYAFLKGVKEGKITNKLTSTLFATRTHRLFNNIAETAVLDYLSGLLIGNELKSLTQDHVYLVGGTSLCERYKAACEALNISSTYLNGDECFLAGMTDLIKVINND